MTREDATRIARQIRCMVVDIIDMASNNFTDTISVDFSQNRLIDYLTKIPDGEDDDVSGDLIDLNNQISNLQYVLGVKEKIILGLREELDDMEKLHAAGRYSIDEDPRGILRICRGKHEKGDPCEWEVYISQRNITKALNPFTLGMEEF